jgi:hypothetical protein
MISSRVITYTPEEVPCETETCGAVVEEGREIEEVEPGNARRAALNTEH